jgi:hypothetical protein
MNRPPNELESQIIAYLREWDPGCEVAIRALTGLAIADAIRELADAVREKKA